MHPACHWPDPPEVGLIPAVMVPSKFWAQSAAGTSAGAQRVTLPAASVYATAARNELRTGVECRAGPRLPPAAFEARRQLSFAHDHGWETQAYRCPSDRPRHHGRGIARRAPLPDRGGDRRSAIDVPNRGPVGAFAAGGRRPPDRDAGAVDVQVHDRSAARPGHGLNGGRSGAAADPTTSPRSFRARPTASLSASASNTGRSVNPEAAFHTYA